MSITKIQHGMIDVAAVDIENLSATGTANNKTYLRGDNTWFELRVFDQDLFTTSTVKFAGLTITNTASMGTLVTDSLTVNNTATISKDLKVTRNIEGNGTLTIDGNSSLRSNLAVNGGLIVNSSATVGPIYGLSSLYISGTTRLRDDARIDGLVTAIAVTATTTIKAGGDVTVGGILRTPELVIGAQKYPTTPGNFGQILWTTGSTGGTKGSTYYNPNEARWGNFSDVIFWNLNTDLQTNGFNIASGHSTNPGTPDPQLTIGTGETGNFSSYMQFKQSGAGIEISADGDVDVLADELYVTGDLRALNGTLSGNLNVDLTVTADTVNAGVISANTATLTEVDGVQGITFADGSVQLTAYTGGGSTGTTSSYVLPIATASRLGGVKVGQYLSINTSTGVLSVTGTPYVLPKATGSILGGIKVGSGLAIDANGVLRVTSTGTVSTGSTMTGVVSLTADMYTNGYYIYRDTGATNNYILLNTDVGIRGADINLLSSGATIVGNTIYDSRLYVSEIKNYSGVGPPLAPEGIQYPDSTIQITAWYGYDQGVFTH